jgi:hypothetical protein
VLRSRVPGERNETRDPRAAPDSPSRAALGPGSLSRVSFACHGDSRGARLAGARSPLT